MLKIGDNLFRHIMPQAGHVKIETAYCDIEVKRHDYDDGRPSEVWSQMTTRLAAEIACVTIDDNGEAQVVLMRKRYATDQPAMIKVPGGYIADQPGFQLLKKVVADTGLDITGHVQYLGAMAGHPEIKTPTGLFATINHAGHTNWRQAGEPREGIECYSVPLETALDIFAHHPVWSRGEFMDIVSVPPDTDHSDGWAQGVGQKALYPVPAHPILDDLDGDYLVNSTGFELLFRLDRALRQGRMLAP